MRHKKPALHQVGIEIDRSVIDSYGKVFSGVCEVINTDAVQWLSSTPLDCSTLIYADPPYFPSTRRRSRVYRFDYSESDHEALLVTLCHLPAMVMLSGYDCDLYRDVLKDWSVHRFQSQSHTGLREESIWFNYPSPKRLHDIGHLGQGFRDREVIKRRQARLKERLLKLTAPERAALHTWLGERLDLETST